MAARRPPCFTDADNHLIRERLAGYEFFVVGREGFWPVDGARPAYFEYQQTMVRDPSSGKWRARCDADS